jgi:phosphoribosylanthranilate isomerase
VAQAQEVAHVVQKYGERTAPLSLQRELDVLRADRLSPKLWFSRAASLLEKITLRRPLLVGVFQDQSVEEVNEVVRDCGLDIVQLHGQESAEEMDRITVPCIKVVHVSPDDNRDRAVAELSNKMAALSGRALAVIMDTSIRGDKAGGTGVTFDWSIASAVGLPVFLAGGLSPINAIDAAKVTSVIGLDVSSGVEVAGQPGIKDTALVEAFLRRE